MATEYRTAQNAPENDSLIKLESSDKAPKIASPFHCPYQQHSLLQQALALDKMRAGDQACLFAI